MNANNRKVRLSVAVLHVSLHFACLYVRSNRLKDESYSLPLSLFLSLSSRSRSLILQIFL